MAFRRKELVAAAESDPNLVCICARKRFQEEKEPVIHGSIEKRTCFSLQGGRKLKKKKNNVEKVYKIKIYQKAIAEETAVLGTLRRLF